jgi:fucose permease
VGQLQHSTALLGILHAAYGLGCAISPIVATRMVESGLGWNSYYYVLLGWAVVNTITIAVTYHPNFMKQKVENEELTEVPATSRKNTANLNVVLSGQAETIPLARRGPLMMVVTNRFCWLVALYLVLYLGLEISTGGWVVEFMIRVSLSSSNLTLGPRRRAV